MTTLSDQRGLRLLRAHLNPAQQLQLSVNGHFTEIKEGRAYTFTLLDWGYASVTSQQVGQSFPRVADHCIGLVNGDDYPAADHALALLLMLRTDLTSFWEVSDSCTTWPTHWTYE